MSSSEPPPLAGFKGMARLFPLPNLVLFPAVIQPLHIFEPRYRELLADALHDDRTMALALLQPGWQELQDTAPPIFPIVCLAKIIHEELLSDGRYNLLVQGMCRAEVLEEVSSTKPYRSARVKVLRDVRVESAVREHLLREELSHQLREWFGEQPAALGQLRKLLRTELSLSTLCDVFSFALDLDPEDKQQMLQELDVGRRTETLLAQIRGKTAPPPPAPRRPFPTDFSIN